MKPRLAGFFTAMAVRPGEKVVLLAPRRWMAIFALLGALVFLNSNVLAQFTALTNTGLPKVHESAVAWGDYNKDGYLDLLICGIDDTLDSTDPKKYLTRVYRNNGNGTFADLNAGLMPMYVSTAAWGDYDNDGFLDILVGGVDTLQNQVTKLYHNNGGLGTFTEVAGIPFHSSSYGCVAWGDYNNDGYPDVLVSGFDVSGQVTKLYRNNKNGTFTEVTLAVFQGVNGMSKLTWADLNNDGFLDVVLCGRTIRSVANPNPVTKVYFNNGGTGTFSENLKTPLVGVWRGSVSVADYNKDALMDILVTGVTTGDSTGIAARDTTLIYINNGDSTFRTSNPGFPGLYLGLAIWGDYDADGYMDILTNGYGNEGKVFRSQGNGDFDVLTLGVEVAVGGIAWGDVNNDGYLDALITGINTATRRDTTLLYRYSGSGSSASFAANTKPTGPTIVGATLSGSTAKFVWNGATDGQTPKAGLTYGLRVGTTPGGIQRVSPLADPASGASNGFRRVAAFGNFGHDTTWSIKNFTSGKYYWSVQAIDNAYAGSVFSSQGYFALPYTITASAGPNGTITPSGAVLVLPDSSQRYSFRPNAGYRVDSVVVDGVYVGRDTTYTFSAVNANHAIRAAFAQGGIRKSVVFYLQGPYVTPGDSMKNQLKIGGQLAARYVGKTIPSRAVDSVYVEIRDSAQASKAKVRRFAPAWLLTDGTICSFSDSTKKYVEYDSAAAGLYYIVVRHRNHLAIMSAAADTVDFKITPIAYDFSTALNKAYGVNAMKAAGAKFAMIGGDGNADGSVDALDRNNVWRPANGTAGFLGADFNMDSSVDALDRNNVWRPNNGSGSQVP